MNDILDGFEIFNGSDLEFHFAQARCYPFHIFTFFAKFVDVILIVGLFVCFTRGRFRFEVVIFEIARFDFRSLLSNYEVQRASR